MGSLDYARYYLDNYGDKNYEKLIDRAEIWKEKMESTCKVHILNKFDLNKQYKDKRNNKFEQYDIDLSRYVLILPEGYSGHKFLDYLRSKKIQAEMSFSRGVVLILSPVNTDDDFYKIYKAILDLDIENIAGDSGSKYYNTIPEKKFEPHEVFSLDSELCEVDKCKIKLQKNQ